MPSVFGKIGFTQISVRVPGELEMATGFLPVYVRKDRDFQAIRAMMMEIDAHEDSLMLQREAASKGTVGEVNARSITLNQRVSLASAILKTFREEYGYFRANARFRTDVRYAVDEIDKLQRITPRTLPYIANHPELLTPARSGQGVRVGRHSYLPRKTLMQQDV